MNLTECQTITEVEAWVSEKYYSTAQTETNVNDALHQAALIGVRRALKCAAGCVDDFGVEKQLNNGLDRGVQDIFRARERVKALDAAAIVKKGM